MPMAQDDWLKIYQNELHDQPGTFFADGSLLVLNHGGRQLFSTHFA